MNKPIIDTADREIFEEFCQLFVHAYPMVDAAGHYLETRLGLQAISVTVCNQRDALSHFVTFLADGPRLPRDKQLAQLNNAEEHLRRAAMEPYQIGAQKVRETLGEAVEEYRKCVVPFLKSEGLRGSPSLSEIEVRVSGIDDLIAKGRSAKGQNMWSSEWEQGMRTLVLAIERGRELRQELQELVARAAGLRMSRYGTRLTIAMTILGVLVGALVSWYFSQPSPVPVLGP